MKDERSQIIQIMPVKDVYVRYKEPDGTYFYDRAIALALTQFYIDGEPYQGVQYLFRADCEILEAGGIQSPEDIFFADELTGLLTEENTRINPPCQP